MADRWCRPMVRAKFVAMLTTRPARTFARPGDPPALRFQRAHLEKHFIDHLDELLNDEHALGRLSGIEEAGQLRTMFASGHLVAVQLREVGKVEAAIRSLVAAITIRTDGVEILLKPDALGIRSEST